MSMPVSRVHRPAQGRARSFPKFDGHFRYGYRADPDGQHCRRCNILMVLFAFDTPAGNRLYCGWCVKETA